MPLVGGFGFLYGIRELALQHYDLNQSEHSVLTNESAPLCNLACLVSAGSRARINIFISHFSHIFSYQIRSCKLARHDAIKIILSQQSFKTLGSANILEGRRREFKDLYVSQLVKLIVRSWSEGGKNSCSNSGLMQSYKAS